MINTKRRKMMTSQKVDTTGSLGSAQKVDHIHRGIVEVENVVVTAAYIQMQMSFD